MTWLNKVGAVLLLFGTSVYLETSIRGLVGNILIFIGAAMFLYDSDKESE
jgi:uncharacterized membrane protein